MDNLGGGANSQIISQLTFKLTSIGEKRVSRNGKPLPRSESRPSPLRSRNLRTSKTNNTVQLTRPATRTQTGEKSLRARAISLPSQPLDTWRKPHAEKQKNPPSRMHRAGVIMDSTHFFNQTATGLDEIPAVHTARFASMCTFGKLLLIPLARSTTLLPAADISPQRATPPPEEATLRPPPTDEATNTYVIRALTGQKPGWTIFPSSACVDMGTPWTMTLRIRRITSTTTLSYGLANAGGSSQRALSYGPSLVVWESTTNHPLTFYFCFSCASPASDPCVGLYHTLH